jgi:hypothetical protein
LDDPHSWGTLAPPPSGAFLHTRGGKIRTFPHQLLGTAAAAEPGAVVVGSAGGTVSAASSKSPIVQTRSAILRATAGVVRKAPSFAHGATYK